MAPRTPTKTSSRASVASASSKVSARSAPKKLATAAHAKESRCSLRVVCEVSSRIVKRVGATVKSECRKVATKLVKVAGRIWDEHQRDLDVMDVDTEDDHEKYDILEKKRLLSSWFEYLSSSEGFVSFDNPQCLKELKAHLEDALDLLDLSDPDTVNLNDLWSFSRTHEWQQFLEGNAQTEQQKTIKKDVDKILEILCERQKTGNCFCNLLLARK